VQSRPINPNKDLSLYGYGSVAWKNRMEEWKRKQFEKMHRTPLGEGNGGELFGDEMDNPDLPMLVFLFYLQFL